MKETPKRPDRDSEILRYVDALDSGDLESIASLWEKASDDPVLEALLLEVEGAVAAEEAKTIRRLPGQISQKPRAWVRRMVVAGALGAACLLVFLLWRSRESSQPGPSLPNREYVTKPPPMDDGSLPVPSQDARTIDKNALTAFAWPLEEKQPIRAGSSIPADLLD